MTCSDLRARDFARQPARAAESPTRFFTEGSKMDATPTTPPATAPKEKWSASVRYRFERRQVEVDVPGYASAIDAIKREAARRFEWPLYDIVLEHGRQVPTPGEAVDSDAAGSARAGDQSDGPNPS
jgi:hypothetical protein